MLSDAVSVRLADYSDLDFVNQEGYLPKEEVLRSNFGERVTAGNGLVL